MTAPSDRIWAVWTEDFGAVQIGTWADSVRHCRTGDEYLLRDGPTMQAAITAAEARGLRKAAELLDAAARDCDHAVIGDTAYHNRDWVEMRRDSYRYAAGKVRALIPAPKENPDE